MHFVCQILISKIQWAFEAERDKYLYNVIAEIWMLASGYICIVSPHGFVSIFYKYLNN